MTLPSEYGGNEEMLMLDNWLESVLRVSMNAFDSVDWVTERASSSEKPVPIISEDSLLE